MLLSINPNSKSKDTMTEEEWVKSWKKFWSEADSASTGKKTKATSARGATEAKRTTGTSLEDRYPGITEQIRRFKEADLPPCPHCGSGDTASVQAGVIGRTMNIAGSTRKFKLVMNMADKKGEYFCNECKKFFD
jgi:hypothetical protein